MKDETLQFFDNASKEVDKHKPERIEAHISRSDFMLAAEYAHKIWAEKLYCFEYDMTAVEKKEKTVLCRFFFKHKKND